MNSTPNFMRFLAAMTVAVATQLGATAANAEGPRVTLEIATEAGLAQESIRDWLPMLEKCGVSSVRVRGGKGGDGASIQASGSGASTSYTVTGVLTSDNRLRLPNGNFTLASSG